MAPVRIFIMVLLVLAAAPDVEAKVFRVGVSPNTLDLGEIHVGESKAATFFIATSSSDEFLVRMKSTPGSTDYLGESSYRDILVNYSEEDASSWITFIENPVVLTHGEGGSGSIKSSKPIRFVVNVPEDAEPGYHSVSIIPDPIYPEGEAGGTNIVTQTVMTVVFHVPGEAIRHGRILDITKGLSRSGMLEIIVYLLNEGTVTIYPTVDQVEIYDIEGNLIEAVRSGKSYIKPNEMVPLKTMVNLANLGDEEYVVSAKASYITGFATKDSVISMNAPPSKPPEVPQAEPGEFPIWLLISAIIIIAAFFFYGRRSRI